jgi:hypothetical protein
MRHIKNYKKFESVDYQIENQFINEIADITLELKDSGYLVDVRVNRFKPVEYEIRISQFGYRNNLITWGELKETIIRITQFSYDNGYMVRFFADGIEFMKGFKNDIDFNGVSDDITQFGFRMLITKI